MQCINLQTYHCVAHIICGMLLLFPTVPQGQKAGQISGTSSVKRQNIILLKTERLYYMNRST
jgi:hypothetical protein